MREHEKSFQSSSFDEWLSTSQLESMLSLSAERPKAEQSRETQLPSHLLRQGLQNRVEGRHSQVGSCAAKLTLPLFRFLQNLLLKFWRCFSLYLCIIAPPHLRASPLPDLIILLLPLAKLVVRKPMRKALSQGGSVIVVPFSSLIREEFHWPASTAFQDLFLEWWVQ